jgi:hypothetical protein
LGVLKIKHKVLLAQKFYFCYNNSMELTKYSRNRFLDTLVTWHVPKEYADPIYNYLVHGFEPGSFFTSVFANDFMAAMRRSHPGNTVEALKAMVGWIQNSCPREAWGSYKQVHAWIDLDAKQRRVILQDYRLVYSEQEEIMLALKNERTVEPMLY